MSRLLRALRHLCALMRIALHLARHDALFPLLWLPGGTVLVWIGRLLVPRRRDVAGKRQGERLALAFQTLGPSFIKLGQALSTRSDLLGEAMAADLSMLQDRLPPFPGATAVAVIEADLGTPLAAVFTGFEPVPVAAASVAQVHFAMTTDGREVAVKVLRPGVAEAFARDLDLLLWIAEGIERRQPGLRRLKPVEVVRRIQETVNFEMDLRLEGAAASEFAENFRGDPDFRVPDVDWDRTARRVLTTARIHGIPIGERALLIEAGFEPLDLMRKASAAFFAMVFRDGLFHADLHPGNLFVAPDGAIAAVDFGIIGRIDRQHRYYLADMLMGFLGGDYRRVAEVHFDAGFVPASESLDAFTQACRSIGEPLQGRPLDQISIARLLSQLFEITRQFNMETQPQLLLLQKTMMLAEGLGRSLDPTINMWVLARPLIEDWMRIHRSAPARAVLAAVELARGLERLPSLFLDLERAVGDLATGGLRLHPDTVKAMEGGDRMRGLVLPIWLAALALAALVLFQLI